MSWWPVAHALIVVISMCRPGGPHLRQLTCGGAKRGVPGRLATDRSLFRGIDGNLEAAARNVSGEKGAGRPLPLAQGEGSRNLFAVDRDIVSTSKYITSCNAMWQYCVEDSSSDCVSYST